MRDNTDLEAIVQSWLEEIKAVPARNPQAAALGRARFLAQAVSASKFQRHKGWTSIFRKEQFAMNILMPILIIAGLLFGGGATVSAARDDLPNDPLYGVKTWSEDLGLQFQGRPDARVERLMELTQVRVQEMKQLVISGQTPPDQVRVRFEEHMQQAFQLCSNMDDSVLDQSLLQLRDQLQQQDHELQRLQLHASEDAQPVLERTRTMLQTRLRLVEDGLLNHETFRNNVRNGFRYGQTQTPPAPIPSMTSTPNGPQHGSATPLLNGPNPDPGGPNPEVTPVQNQDGNGNSNSDCSGNGSGCNQNGDGPGGQDSGGQESGGNGSGGDHSGGDGSGGNGSGGNHP